MTDYISIKFSGGGYDTSLNVDEFAFEITKDLRMLSNDQHINVSSRRYNCIQDSLQGERQVARDIPNWLKLQMKKSNNPIKLWGKEYEKTSDDDNFTYGDIKILPGNIGYLEIVAFKRASINRKNDKNKIKIDEAFKFLQKSNTIIIDLRENIGGSIDLAAKFCSYFTTQPDAYFITSESIARYDSSGIQKELSIFKKHLTKNVFQGFSITKKSIFILVSKRTFSAGVTVASKIKQFMPQSVIVGEQTIGAGNGINSIIEHNSYKAIISSIKFFDENNDKNNFDSLGIIPDIIVSSDSAFTIAYKLSINNSPDEHTQKVNYFYKAKVLRNAINIDNITDYVGNYRKIIIYQNHGELYMIYDTFRKQLLSPIENDLFFSSEFKIIRFIKANSKIIAIEIKHSDRTSERFRKM